MSILKIEDLVSGYDPKKPVIRGINFNVEDGQFVGIVGPNGSGKTTLLRTIIGLVRIFHGAVLVSQHRIDHLERRELARRIAFVPQLMEPVEGFSVEDLVMLGRTPYWERFSFETAADLEAVKWAIEELKIDSLKERPVT
jgi:iron complex transport system ATP-binding protein